MVGPIFCFLIVFKCISIGIGVSIGLGIDDKDNLDWKKKWLGFQNILTNKNRFSSRSVFDQNFAVAAEKKTGSLSIKKF